MESGRIAPPGSSRTSGGTALPPATPVGQICTMYNDFPLHGNTQKLKPHNDTPRFSASFQGAPWRVLAPSCSKSVGRALVRMPLAPGGPWRPGCFWRRLKVLEAAPAGWRPLKAFEGLWRFLEALVLHVYLLVRRSEKTIFWR